MTRRISRYYPGCDGTRLAVDLYLPESDVPVPLIFQCSVGERRPPEDSPEGAEMREQYAFWLEKGYAVARMEPRGVGASYGVSEGFWSPLDGRDMKKVIDTLAQEPWCTGRVGMYGGSNLGASQHLVAKYRPEHLCCILPCDCSTDMYYQNYPNGVPILPKGGMPAGEPHLGTPVDEDPAPDYPMAHEARACHERNMPFLSQYTAHMHRDSINPRIGYAPNLEIPIWEDMNALRFSRTVSTAYGAWFDPGCTSKILEYRQWGGRLLLGPWRHVEVYAPKGKFPQDDIDWKADHLEFFDYHLKNSQNDVMKRPPVRYYTVGDEEPWHFAADFPLDSQTSPELRLTPEGGLTDGTSPEGTLSYRVREDITVFRSMGRLNRLIEENLAGENEKCLCFTTEPLNKDLELTGFPVAELYVTSPFPDGIFLAELEEITPDGFCRALTEGMIRARNAAIGHTPVTDAVGIPYHSGLERDDVSLSPTEPTLLAFHLEALSRVIPAGSRLCLALYCGGNGFSQPEGLPEGTTVTFHFGGACDARLRLPVIAPNVTRFRGEGEEWYAFKRALYRKNADGWSCFPCRQVYPAPDGTHFVTESFTALRAQEGDSLRLTVQGEGLFFSAAEKRPDRMTFSEKSTQIPPARRGGENEKIRPTFRNLYVATVPCGKEAEGEFNPQMRYTLDLFVDVVLPEGKGPFPCIVQIHGFGGNNHQFEPLTPRLLEKGYACASIDYRLMPPNRWPASAEDARACLRYLKAHAAELSLDPERFGLMGGSMGGQLTAMLAACNGDPACEGDIGGIREVDCSVRAAVALFAPTDLFAFGEDCAQAWPQQPEKVANGDGPFAPIASMIGYAGPGRGMGDLKRRLFEENPEIRQRIEIARDASPVAHVSSHSAPLCLVHGLHDYGIQVPMGQSLRMFEALTRKGVKSLVLLNNNGPYGDDPEVREAMLDFLCRRV